jgi:hypothetical protein
MQLAEQAQASHHAGLDDEESRRIFGSDNPAVKKCVVIYTLHFLDNDDLYVVTWLLLRWTSLLVCLSGTVAADTTPSPSTP